MSTLRLNSKMQAYLLYTFFAALLAAPGFAMAIEEPQYTVETKTDAYEIRNYSPVIVAETRVQAGFDEAGNIAFEKLAGFIFGKNTARRPIQASGTVMQERQSEKIAMTAPVNQVKSKDAYWVQFTMPSSYTLDTLPMPNDPSVQIRRIPARRVAVFRYSGSWSEENYNNKLEEFRKQLAKDKISTTGEPVFARFNSPFSLWFMRRNEIWLELGS